MCLIPIHVHLSRRIANMKMAPCIQLAGYRFQISLSIPSNRRSLRVFDPVLPLPLFSVPPYAANPKPSTDWPPIGVIVYSNGYLFT